VWLKVPLLLVEGDGMLVERNPRNLVVEEL
jgi:hypothetical protein